MNQFLMCYFRSQTFELFPTPTDMLDMVFIRRGYSLRQLLNSSVMAEHIHVLGENVFLACTSLIQERFSKLGS
jgi:hypothetical protein